MQFRLAPALVCLPCPALLVRLDLGLGRRGLEPGGEDGVRVSGGLLMFLHAMHYTHYVPL